MELARRLAPSILVLVGLVILREAYVDLSGISPLVLPAPSRILTALIDFRDQAVTHTIPTVVETVVGFSVSVTAAVAVAIAMDQSATLRRALYPLLVGSQTIPIIALAPLFVLWFGFGLLPM